LVSRNQVFGLGKKGKEEETKGRKKKHSLTNLELIRRHGASDAHQKLGSIMETLIMILVSIVTTNPSFTWPSYFFQLFAAFLLSMVLLVS